MISNLSDEIASALRKDLTSGRWGVGMALPSVDDLREQFGAGEYAVRRALKQLRDEGFITLRQRVGAVATEKISQAWKGTVAFVHVGAVGSYYSNRLAQQLTWRFETAGWRTASIFLAVAKDGSIDLSILRRHLANGLSLVVGLFARYEISDMISAAGVPHVVLGGYTRDFPKALGIIRNDVRPCYDQLICALKDCRVKTILEFDFDRLMDRSFKKQLFDAGFNVHRVLHKFDGDGFGLGVIREAGYRTVADFFADERNRRKLPDAILFDDDYFAAGGIVALLEADIRIPEDVGVVSFMNRGNELAIGKKITGIGCDPAADGEIVAAYVLKLLAGKHPAPPRLPWRFFPGESLITPLSRMRTR